MENLSVAYVVLAFGLAWQLNVYLRTDVYYLIANFTGCRNLAGDAASYLKAKLAWLLTGAARDPLAGVPQRERLFVQGFAAVMVAGTATVVALGAACLGGVALALLHRTGITPAATQPGPVPVQQGLWPLLASLGLTGGWLVWAAIARRRRRPHLCYRLRAPEDL